MNGGLRRGRTPALVALACLVLVGTTAVFAGCRREAADLVRAEETVKQSVDLAIWSMSPQIEIETFNGNVTVTAGTSASADVTVAKRASAPDAAAARALLDDIAVSVDDLGTARVRVRASRSSDPTGGATSGADVTVNVPCISAVSIRSSNGAVRVERLIGPVAVRTSNSGVTVAAGGCDVSMFGADTSVDVETSNGEVTVTGPARDVRARTSNARVQIEEARGSLDVDTSNGSITITASEATVAARTSNAYIRFAGSLAPGDQRFETSNGTVTLELPAAASFRLSARTSGGGVLSEFALVPVPPANATDVDATAGADPRASITIVTSNGDVKIRKKG